MSKALFERLISAASQRGVEISTASEGRFIRRLNELDAQLMATGSARLLSLSRQIRMVRIEFQEDVYFCAFGLPQPETLPLGLQLVEVTPGLFAVSVLEALVQPAMSVTGATILDVIGDQYQGVKGYEGHELADVMRLFPLLSAFKVAQEEEFHKNDHRVLGALLARGYADGPISISLSTIEKIWITFEQGSRHLPFNVLVQGLLSISWENLYLETYRCLEQLYSAPRLSDLKGSWHSALSLRDLAVLLERHLSWRPKEDDALRKMIVECGATYVAGLCLSFEMVDAGESHEDRGDLVSRKVYALRNNIVHYRPIHEGILKSDAQWDAIVAALLDLVNEVYEQRGASFFEPAEVNADLGPA